ncbi:carbohydrate ABC transporter permease [Acidobacteria bacterium ACD]|nr:carbohydrate ABC transporter permease [Acidobacteria bacterium ACD]
MEADVKASRLLPGLALAFLVAWSLGPALWQALTALKPVAQITSVPTVYVPNPPTLRSFEALFARKPFASYLRNSALVSAAATLLAVATGALVASRLVRASERARERALVALLGLAFVPPVLLLFPLFEAVRALGWLNNPLALIVPYAVLNLPLSTWILESGFRQVPREVLEAAALDGLGPVARVARIQLPLAAPSVATAAILVFIFCWNEFLLALTFMTRDERKTVTAGVASVTGSSMFEVPWGQLSAAVVLSTLPLVLLVLLFERRIASGLTRGAVKG